MDDNDAVVFQRASELVEEIEMLLTGHVMAAGDWRRRLEQDGRRRRSIGSGGGRRGLGALRRLDLDEGVDDAPVVHDVAPVLQNLQRVGCLHTRTVRPIGRQRVEAVHHLQNPGANRNLLAGKAVRITCAVPVLMVMPDDRHDGIREFDHRQDVGADRRMTLHHLELGRRELSRFVQDVLGHRQLADVVQQRRGSDRLQLHIVRDAERVSEAEGIVLDPPDVIARDLILRVDGMRKRFDGREVDVVHLAEVADFVFGPAHRVPERHVENHGQRTEQHHGIQRIVPAEKHHQHGREHAAKIGDPQDGQSAGARSRQSIRAVRG